MPIGDLPGEQSLNFISSQGIARVLAIHDYQDIIASDLIGWGDQVVWLPNADSQINGLRVQKVRCTLLGFDNIRTRTVVQTSQPGNACCCVMDDEWFWCDGWRGGIAGRQQEAAKK
jgi:hypothetical protein